MKKTIILITGTLIASILAIVILYLVTDHYNHRKNNFIRLFPPHPVLFSKSVDLGYNSFYVAGATTERIYLGNVTAPFYFLTMNYTLTDTQYVSIQIKDLEKLKLQSVILKVDSPYFYLLDGIAPHILSGTLNDMIAAPYMYDSIYFTEPALISHTSLAMRVVTNDTREYLLAKQTNSPPYIKPAPGLLQKQVDGLFCTDGMLHYDRDLAQLIYVYHYRNQFICMDTSLNLLYRGKTIDTISHAQIKVAEIRSDKSITMAAPPLMVNKRSYVYKNWLFIHSNLLANNEDKELFDKASVIDVYDLGNGSYQFSFYLFDEMEKKLTTFTVFNNMLLAIHDRYLVEYNLSKNFFKETDVSN